MFEDNKSQSILMCTIRLIKKSQRFLEHLFWLVKWIPLKTFSGVLLSLLRHFNLHYLSIQLDFYIYIYIYIYINFWFSCFSYLIQYLLGSVLLHVHLCLKKRKNSNLEIPNFFLLNLPSFSSSKVVVQHRLALFC